MNWGEQIFSGGLLVAIPIALLAGLVSFASPCVLPLVPGYLAYASGNTSPGTTGERRRLIIGTALFVTGFALVFVAYGAAFGALGSWLIQWQDPITRILGVILAALAAQFVLDGLERSLPGLAG